MEKIYMQRELDSVKEQSIAQADSSSSTIHKVLIQNFTGEWFLRVSRCIYGVYDCVVKVPLLLLDNSRD